MATLSDVSTVLSHLNTLFSGLFLLTAIGLVAMRQVLACVRLFVLQSLLLSASVLVQAFPNGSFHLLIVASLVPLSRALLIPWILGRTLRREVFTRREITQALNIPTSLLIALALVVLAYFVSAPLVTAVDGAPVLASLPAGLSALLLGTYSIGVRREAVPQLLGILSAENGAFFAGIAVAGGLPIIVEIAATLDVVIVAIVLGLLIRRIQQRVGNTAVGNLTALRER